jgi:N-acetylmuramoyl-L-alanine amidase
MNKLPLLAVLGTFALVLVSSCGFGSRRRPPALGGSSPVPPAQIQSAPRITAALIAKGRFARHRIRSMNPRYITIHSTQNSDPGTDARAHANLLRRGAIKGEKNSLGYISWHYTVDDHSIYQSLPDNEQGQHADYEGKGNRQSIGIEMCENRDGNLAATIDRAARLTAYLMKKHDIPLRRVVPHQHWPRTRYADGRDLGRKNCPHFLLSNGKPGPKWRAFLGQVRRYRARY